MPPQFYSRKKRRQHFRSLISGFGVLPTGIPRAVEILNSIEGSLGNVLMSVVSSDNNTEVSVPDSANSNMEVIEMASVELLLVGTKIMYAWKTYSQRPYGS
jgi:hypothetical protein